MQTRPQSQPTPVGVTIAYRSTQEERLRRSRQNLREESSPPPLAKTPERKEKKAEKETKKLSSLQVFLEGFTLYVACLIVPSLIGYVYQRFQALDAETRRENEVMSETPPSLSSYISSSYAYSHYRSAAGYLCPEPHLVEADSYTAWFCPSVKPEELDEPKIYSPDARWTDFGLIAAFSLTLALVRVLLVQLLVPMDDSKTLEAMVRCKSIHLLSADYQLTPLLDRPTVVIDSSVPVLPNLGDDDSAMGVGLGIDESDGLEQPPAPVPPSSTLVAIASSAASPTRVYAAPRFATAVFRLLYSATAAALAYYWFHSADFWPWYVGGSGATRNCWDLSGGLTLAMDSDFDQRNRVLKLYFLWQASYHWHSGAFHLLSMMMLVLHPKHAPARFLSVQTTTSAYFRSLLQHVLALVLIGIGYVFSSLRRLAAIGIFAFDVSSCFLHLLQICVNAKPESVWRRPKVVGTMYYGLVLPSFVVTRFFIWPNLWSSAAAESQVWLRQVEYTLFPGAAKLLHTMLHLWMILLEGLAIKYFGRLYRHPHLRAIMRPVEVNDK